MKIKHRLSINTTDFYIEMVLGQNDTFTVICVMKFMMKYN